MTGFLRPCFHRKLRKEEVLNRFFDSDFDPNILEEQRGRHEQSHGDRGEPSLSGLRDPNEDPIEDMTLDLENRRYNFYLRPAWGGT
jgi:hypothetical protein